MMSMLILLKGPLHKLELFMRRLFWQVDDIYNMYNFVCWKEVCQPIDRGLGVVDLQAMNICVLSKWFWKLENNEGVWHSVIGKEYCNKELMVCVKRKLA